MCGSNATSRWVNSRSHCALEQPEDLGTSPRQTTCLTELCIALLYNKHHRSYANNHMAHHSIWSPLPQRDTFHPHAHITTIFTRYYFHKHSNTPIHTHIRIHILPETVPTITPEPLCPQTLQYTHTCSCTSPLFNNTSNTHPYPWFRTPNKPCQQPTHTHIHAHVPLALTLPLYTHTTLIPHTQNRPNNHIRHVVVSTTNPPPTP